jgi:hypothetical protein
MLFRKKITRSCLYCQHATKLNDEQILCAKKGVVSCENACRKFKYDPCKRVPVKAKAMDFSQYSPEDFKL